MDRAMIAVIELAGEINTNVLEELSALIAALVDQHRRHVVVNLSGIARFDGRDVDSLIERAKQLRSIGGDLKIVGLERASAPRSSTLHAARFFEPYESLEAAVSGFHCESALQAAPSP
jgi:anti-anti-sigma factor